MDTNDLDIANSLLAMSNHISNNIEKPISDLNMLNNTIVTDLKNSNNDYDLLNTNNCNLLPNLHQNINNNPIVSKFENVDDSEYDSKMYNHSYNQITDYLHPSTIFKSNISDTNLLSNVSESINTLNCFNLSKNDVQESTSLNTLTQNSNFANNIKLEYISIDAYKSKNHHLTMSEIKSEPDMVGDLDDETNCLELDELVYGHRILDELMDGTNRLYNWMFLDPVDVREASDYYYLIKQPIWLKKMKEKFESKTYKTILDFASDFKLMISNALEYNGLAHPVSKKAKKLEIMFYQKLNLLPSFIKDKFKVNSTRPIQKRFYKHRAAISAEKSAWLRKQRIETAGRMRLKKMRRVEVMQAARVNFNETLQQWETQLMQGSDYKHVWMLPQIGMFLNSTISSMKIYISQFELERCFQLPEQSSIFSRLLTSLLFSHYTRKQMSEWDILSFDEWHVKLKALLNTWYKTYNDNNKNAYYVLQKHGIEEEFFKILGDVNPLSNDSFLNLNYNQKVWIIKSLCDYVMESQKVLTEVMDDLPAEVHRPTVLGRDSKGLEYLYFHQFENNEIRIYKQTAHDFKYKSKNHPDTVKHKSCKFKKEKKLYSINCSSENDDDEDDDDEEDDDYSSDNTRNEDSDMDLIKTKSVQNNVELCHSTGRRLRNRNLGKALNLEINKKDNNCSDSKYSKRIKLEQNMGWIDEVGSEKTSTKKSASNGEFNQLLLTPRRSLRKVMEESKRDITPTKTNLSMLEESNSLNLDITEGYAVSRRSLRHKDTFESEKRILNKNHKIDNNQKKNVTLDKEANIDKEEIISDLEERSGKEDKKEKSLKKTSSKLLSISKKNNFVSNNLKNETKLIKSRNKIKTPSYSKEKYKDINPAQSNTSLSKDEAFKNLATSSLIGGSLHDLNYETDLIEFELVVENIDDLRQLINFFEDKNKPETEEEDQNLTKQTEITEIKLKRNLEKLLAKLLPLEQKYLQFVKKKKIELRREMEKYDNNKKIRLLKEAQKNELNKMNKELVKAEKVDDDSSKMQQKYNDDNKDKCIGQSNVNDLNYSGEVNPEEQPAKKKFKNSLFEPGEILTSRTRIKKSISQVKPTKQIKRMRLPRSTNLQHHDYAYEDHPFFSDNGFINGELNKHVSASQTNTMNIPVNINLKDTESINRGVAKLNEKKRKLVNQDNKGNTVGVLSENIIMRTNNTAIESTGIATSLLQRFPPFIPNLLRSNNNKNMTLTTSLRNTNIANTVNQFGYSLPTIISKSHIQRHQNNTFGKLLDQTILTNFKSQTPNKSLYLNQLTTNATILGSKESNLSQNQQNIDKFNMQIVPNSGLNSILTQNKLLNQTDILANKLLILNSASINNIVSNNYNNPTINALVSQNVNLTASITPSKPTILYLVKSSNLSNVIHSNRLVNSNINSTPRSNVLNINSMLTLANRIPIRFNNLLNSNAQLNTTTILPNFITNTYSPITNSIKPRTNILPLSNIDLSKFSILSNDSLKLSSNSSEALSSINYLGTISNVNSNVLSHINFTNISQLNKNSLSQAYSQGISQESIVHLNNMSPISISKIIKSQDISMLNNSANFEKIFNSSQIKLIDSSTTKNNFNFINSSSNVDNQCSNIVIIKK